MTDWSAKLRVRDLTFIPMSALTGENVIARSKEMSWYGGSPLLHHLETVHIASDRNLIDARFPVQWVIRPQSEKPNDYRGYAGVVAGGVLRAGDPIVALPSGFETRVARVETYDGPLEEAFPPMAVTVHLEDAVDVSRGDMLCRPHNRPHVGTSLDATVSWMASQPLTLGNRYALKHTTRWVRAVVSEVQYELDVNTLHRDETADSLGLNAIGRVRLQATEPLVYDPYERNRMTGSFILVDETSHTTVGAGMLLPPASLETRRDLVGGGGAESPGVFVTGTDTGIGKTVVSCALVAALRDRGVEAVGMKNQRAAAECAELEIDRT